MSAPAANPAADPAHPVRPGIFVATPVYGATCYMPYVSGLLSLQRACAAAGIGFDHFYVSGTALLHEQRNVAVAAFMHHSDLSHMLFVDADVGFEGADILRMFAAGEDVVLGAYPAKHINWTAVIAAARHRPDWTAEQIAHHAADFSSVFYGLDGQEEMAPDSLCEIHSGGAGLMLLARSVFQRLERAYPEQRGRFPDSYRHLVPDIDELVAHFTFLTEDDGRMLSEDISFCKKWRDLGGRIFAATWLSTVHVGPYYFKGNLPALFHR